MPKNLEGPTKLPCEYCGGRKIILNPDGTASHCVCNLEMVYKVKLKELYAPMDKWVHVKALQLIMEKRQSMVYVMNEGMKEFKCKVSPVLADALNRKRKWRVFDGLKLSAIYFNRDTEFESPHLLQEYIRDELDFIVILVGFTDPTINNLHITGNIIASVLNHCEVVEKPFWALLKRPMSSIEKSYGDELPEILKAVKYKFE